MNTSSFRKGLWHGVPIALGYLSVSFGFGILAIRAGLSVAAAVGISVTNLTSAGQAAGVAVIAAGGTYLEMALTQFVINLRYALMGLSLSQKLDDGFHTPQRLLVAFGITDEIFAMACAQEDRVSPSYMYGLILISFAGWSLGTFFGAAAGRILPASVTSAMGLVLYGMFLAIFIPPARKSRGVFTAVCIAALCSVLFRYVLTAVSEGFSIIVCAVIAAAVCAAVFPVAETTQQSDDREEEKK
jgi:predicted branched-subunit amino acid permease